MSNLYILNQDSFYFKVIAKNGTSLDIRVTTSGTRAKKTCIYNESDLFSWNSELGRDVLDHIQQLNQLKIASSGPWIPNQYILVGMPKNRKKVLAIVIPFRNLTVIEQ